MKIRWNKFIEPTPSNITTKNKFNLSELENCAKHSAYGRSLWLAKQHCMAALFIMMSEIKDSKTPSLASCKKFVEQFSAGAQIEYLVFGWPLQIQDRTVSIITHLLKQKTTFDEDVRICYTALRGLHELEKCTAFLDECIQLYPQNVYFLQWRACLKAFQNCYEDGVRDTREALKLDPQNVEILYDQAAMMRLTENLKPEDAIKAYEQFLKLAPKDHRKVPEAYYAIASQTFLTISKLGLQDEKEYLPQVKKYYELGLEAEKRQLSFFLPYESNNKAMIECFLTLFAKASGTPTTLPFNPEPAIQETSTLRPVLKDRIRISKILNHRNGAQQFKDFRSLTPTTIKPPRKQQLPKSLADLKTISLDGMDVNRDYVYEGCVFPATVIDDIYNTGSSICILIEDVHGCVERCFIYNLPYMHNMNEARTTLAPGRKLSIINPYMRMATDGLPTIRVDDPSSIVLEGLVQKMCRYCCKPNANHLCGRCGTASYCDKNCQTLDWKEMRHKLICQSLSA